MNGWHRIISTDKGQDIISGGAQCNSIVAQGPTHGTNSPNSVYTSFQIFRVKLYAEEGFPYKSFGFFGSPDQRSHRCVPDLVGTFGRFIGDWCIGPLTHSV